MCIVMYVCMHIHIYTLLYMNVWVYMLPWSLWLVEEFFLKPNNNFFFFSNIRMPVLSHCCLSAVNSLITIAAITSKNKMLLISTLFRYHQPLLALLYLIGPSPLQRKYTICIWMFPFPNKKRYSRNDQPSRLDSYIFFRQNFSFSCIQMIFHFCSCQVCKASHHQNWEKIFFKSKKWQTETEASFCFSI